MTIDMRHGGMMGNEFDPAQGAWFYYELWCQAQARRIKRLNDICDRLAAAGRSHD